MLQLAKLIISQDLFRLERHAELPSRLNVCSYTSWAIDDQVIWWRHQMESFPALLSLCEGNPSVTGGFPSKGHWRGTFMFSLICAWTNGWANNRDAVDLRRQRANYDVTVMKFGATTSFGPAYGTGRLGVTWHGVKWHILSVPTGIADEQWWTAKRKCFIRQPTEALWSISRAVHRRPARRRLMDSEQRRFMEKKKRYSMRNRS